MRKPRKGKGSRSRENKNQRGTHARAQNGMRTREGRAGRNPEVGTLRKRIWERQKEGGGGVGLNKRGRQRERRRESGTEKGDLARTCNAAASVVADSPAASVPPKAANSGATMFMAAPCACGTHTHTTHTPINITCMSDRGTERCRAGAPSGAPVRHRSVGTARCPTKEEGTSDQAA